MIALIDYGAGNLASVRKAIAAAGGEAVTPSAPDDLHHADGIIIPGVGHFGATRAMDDRWRAAIRAAVEQGVPLLGVCLGLQFLFDGSDEAPDLPGLGLLAGRCALLPPTLKVPHVGWNEIRMTRPSMLLAGIADRERMYFTHSYAAPVTSACVATSEHSVPFAAAVEDGPIAGVQFHPEKSAGAGLRILRSFVTLTKSPTP